MPSVPSTLIIWPVRMAAVARPVPTTAGSRYSRATIAAWDITPPTSVTVALIFEKIGAHAGEVLPQTRISPSRTSPICSADLTTRATPSTTPGDAAAPFSTEPPSCWRAHSCTRSVVTPHSMIVIGSVTASGVTPIAGGGLHSPSVARISLRRATIGGQCFGPSATPPVAQVSTSSSSALATS